MFHLFANIKTMENLSGNFSIIWQYHYYLKEWHLSGNVISCLPNIKSMQNRDIYPVKFSFICQYQNYVEQRLLYANVFAYFPNIKIM